jgi:hypothetical protein
MYLPGNYRQEFKGNAPVTFTIPTKEEIDAGKRVSDAVTLHLVASSDHLENVGRWCAFRMDTGEELKGKTTFDSKDEAMFYALPREREYCYLEITPDGISPSDAVRFLRINRHPMIDNCAPAFVTNRALFPRFSNLSRRQRLALKAEAERQALDAR